MRPCRAGREVAEGAESIRAFQLEPSAAEQMLNLKPNNIKPEMHINM